MNSKRTVHLTVNGVAREGLAEPRKLLVHFLREELALTGTHIGCDTGHCGACASLVGGRSVKSCMIVAVQAEGRSITTIEGLERFGHLHPIQEAFREHHGLQCGYCTPGMILSALYLLQNHPAPSEEEIRSAIAGNLCRGTGYVNIVKSIQAAAKTFASQKDVTAPLTQP